MPEKTNVKLEMTINDTSLSATGWANLLRELLVGQDRIHFAQADLDSIRVAEEPTVEEAFGEPLYSLRVKGDTAEASTYSAAALALHTLAKENGE